MTCRSVPQYCHGLFDILVVTVGTGGLDADSDSLHVLQRLYFFIPPNFALALACYYALMAFKGL